jgi:hypothetical protein
MQHIKGRPKKTQKDQQMLSKIPRHNQNKPKQKGEEIQS